MAQHLCFNFSFSTLCSPLSSAVHAYSPQNYQALALLALPAHLQVSLQELSLLSDEILFLAGDISVDTSWYTKRASLAAIYASSELFMTQDDSPGFVETQEFLNRRLDEAEKAIDAVGMARTWMGMQGIGLVNILRSKGVRI